MNTPPGPWGPQDLVDAKAWLLHNESGVVGRAHMFHEPGQLIGPNGKPVMAPVLVLDTGDQFVIRGEETFTPLSAREVQFVEGATQLLGHTITIVLRQAKALKIELPAAALLLLGVHKVNERVLDLEARKLVTPKQEKKDG